MAKLNEQQQKAVNSDANVVVVIAGAGSGKTTVLTEKVARIIETDMASAREVLAITFTNKATNEMKERLNARLGQQIAGAWIMTFHGFSLRIIRENLDYLPHHDHNLVIVDEDDKKKILKDILKRLNLDGDYKIPEVVRKIANAKKDAMVIDDIKYNIDFEFTDIYNEYEKYLNANNAFDFDDLLIVCHQLLKIDEVAKKYQNRFKYIHVDEYQDTSLVQGEILKKLKSPTNNLFIVGDVDQSIYGWRGATIENIMSLEKTFDNVEIVKLEQNYRSTKRIIDAANTLIEYNNNRYDKNLWTENPLGEKIKAFRFNDASKEADFIKSEVNYLIDFGKVPSEIAILYRFNYQSKKVEEALMRARIPYLIYGGLRFYERMEIKDMIAYTRLIMNRNDNISFLRIINVPKRKVGDVSLQKIINFANQEQISYFEAALQVGGKSVQEFCKIISSYEELLVNNFAEEFDNLINDIGYYEYLLKSEDSERVQERAENVRELKEAIEEALENSMSLNEYLTELTLFSERETDEDSGAVVLSTVHGVKGLEFDYVFLTGMNETKFPKVDETNPEELEEERRVAYVAVTRARKKLVITNISYDFKNEYYEDSRFIEEMAIDATEQVEYNSFIF